ncbi:MAG: chemotaxis protein CheW [Sphingomonadaceae bacterium]|nr:chemotaxis protein CheW [Sphingomonadaceae bacterium]
MDSLYLIAHLNGACVGIDSSAIESIVHVQDVVPVPRCDPSIAGLFALRSRVLTLVDTQYLVTGIRKQVEKGALAVVVEIAGHQYGLLVDRVEDVVSILPGQIEDRVKPAAEWAALAKCTASVDGRLVMLLDPESLVQGQISLAA